MKYDKTGNIIGDGKWHSDYNVIDFNDYPQITFNVSKSETTESVYVTYTNQDNKNFITARFSNHENNAVKFGEQLDGNTTTKNEILYRLGLKKRVFIPKKRLFIQTNQIKKKRIEEFEESDKTIEELYSLGANADLSKYKGKRAKGSNYLVLSDTVEVFDDIGVDKFGNPVQRGHYIYQDLDKHIYKNGGEVNIFTYTIGGI